MQIIPINNVSYDDTIKAFQPFYKEILTKDDAIEIQNNLFGLCNLLRKNKEKQAYEKSLC